jgi:TonB-linked SusC/RagA family outer membrane protein
VPEDKWKIADRWSFISYFGRVNYNYNSKLFLQALARVDGSSRFGPNNRLGFFPSVSAAYQLTEENFFRDALPFFNTFKLRTSYGVTGNANIPSFLYLQTWTYQRSGTDLYNGQPILFPNNLENEDLKWERLNNFDAGVEFGINKNRITGEVAYYNKTSSDILLQVNLPASAGLGGRVFRNIGKVKNQGIELSTNIKLIDRRDFSLSINGNAARNYNEVVDLSGLGPDDIETGTDEGRLLPGYPIGTRYSVVYLGVDPADGLPIYMDRDGKSTKVWPGLGARRPIGKNIPDWIGGFGSNLNYKGFELTTLFVFAQGLDIWDNSGKYQFYGIGAEGNNNFRQDFLDHWRQPGDNARYPRLSYNNTYPGWPGLDFASSSMLIQKGDYLRLRELTLAYRISPASLDRLKIKGLRLFVTGSNLFLWTNYTAGDPEINRDADGGVTARNMNPNVNFLTPPQAKSVTFGLNVSF